MKNLPKHLGGHAFVTHEDKGAFRALDKRLYIETMWDLGCGPGGQVRLAQSLGTEAGGIDGDFTQEPDICHDFNEAPLVGLEKRDLCWSVEFVEHVAEQFIPHYLPVMQACAHICMTFAPVGATGHHHVNCQPEEYWIRLLENNGFSLDRELTDLVRAESTMVRDFMRNCGLVFENANAQNPSW